VDELVETSTWQYAVICVRSEPDRERLVIAYPDEETLRNLIAAPSIVTLGYSSRADALKNIDRSAVVHTTLTFLTECRVVLRRVAGGFGPSGASRVMRSLLHNGFAAALIFFYSRNVLSSTVRAIISF
jgi:hypothetical protein